MTIIRPQPAQEKLLSSPADIAVFGGAAGGGKSWALLMQPILHIKNPGFGCVIFRKTNPMIVGEGGLWDKSQELYPFVGGQPFYGNPKRWIFKSGAKITLSHMQHEKDKHNWDGQQIPLIEWDELDQFSESQFWYMLSRNRSTCGVRPYMRATCNPNSESWVARLLDWWIDQDSGYPIYERSGVLRWFIRLDGKLEWGSDWADMHRRFPDVVMPVGAVASETEKRIRPLSITFVPARLDDNRILETKDPEYRAKLMAMPLVERERLLNGNWKIRPEAGMKFPRDKWVLKEACPEGIRWVRFWDRAFTEGGTGARTAGVLIGELFNHAALALPRYWIKHVAAGRWGDAERESQMKYRADADRATYGHVTIGIEEEGGAGKHSAHVTVSNLAGHDVYTERPTAKKHIRWGPLAAQQQIRNVAIVTTPDWDWAGAIDELDALAGDEALDKGKLRDIADAASGGFKFLTASGMIIQGELLASGDPEHLEEESKPYSEEEIGELPDDWKELIIESNEAARERRGFYGGRDD